MLPARPVKLTASGQVTSYPARLVGLICKGGVDAFTIELSDKIGSGGASKVDWGGAIASYSSPALPAGGIYFANGIYLTVVTGTTPTIEAFVIPEPGQTATFV